MYALFTYCTKTNSIFVQTKLQYCEIAYLLQSHVTCIITDIISRYFKPREVVLQSIENLPWQTWSMGTLRDEDGNANDENSEKSHFWLAIFFYVKFIRVLFSPPTTLWENEGMFLHEAKQLLRIFVNYILVVSITLKKVFSHSNFSNNYVQVFSIPTCSYCIYYNCFFLSLSAVAYWLL